MPKRVCHIIKETKTYHHLAEKNDGVTTVPYTDFYLCGKSDRYLKDDPDNMTQAEHDKHEAFKAEMEINPWPVCKKCKKAKDSLKAKGF